MQALYSLSGEGKEAAGYNWGKKKHEKAGWGTMQKKTHKHMETVSISAVAGCSPLSFSLCSFFFFIFDLLRPKNRNQIASAAP